MDGGGWGGAGTVSGSTEGRHRIMTDLIRLRLEWTGPGGAGLSTFYFTEAGGSSGDDAAAAVEDFVNGIRGNVANDWTATLSGVQAVIDDATGTLVGTTGIGGGFTISGDNSNEKSPLATQGLIQWGTGSVVSGRILRGRTFVPGVTDAVNDEGKPTSGYISALNTAAAALIADASSVFRVWSRAHGTSAPVTSGGTWSQFAVLRSRRD